MLGLLAVAALLPACSPSDDFIFYRRFDVSLSHGSEPIDIDVVIGCRSRERHILGEPASFRMVRVPYIFGVRTRDGHGVLVQTPAVCERDLEKNPVPADFLPVVLWAEKADDLEFTTAYLSGDAYRQPVSQLQFHKATVVEASAADYAAWLKSAPQNLALQNDHPHWFDIRSDVNEQFLMGGYPLQDPRSKLPIYCHSLRKLPIPIEDQAAVEKRLPQNASDYWFLNEPFPAVFGKSLSQVSDDAWRLLAKHASWRTEILDFSEGTGISRANGIGSLSDLRITSGPAPRLPFYFTTGVPWAGTNPKRSGDFEIHIDAQGGLDQGFAYCYRDRLFDQWIDNDSRLGFGPLNAEFFVDHIPSGKVADYRLYLSIQPVIESVNYFLQVEIFQLSDEWASMQ